MGSILTASCACGFEQDGIAVGGGMLNFQTYCGAPALCSHCSLLVVRNYLGKAPRCPHCRKKVTYYDDPSVQAATATDEEIFTWNLDDDRIFRLPATEYRCPKCGQMTMKLKQVGCWD